MLLRQGEHVAAEIDRERVKAIATERGLIAVDAALSDDEVDNLIFMPGFSTAAAVSDISGRGVGMDVVKRSIQELGGRISIASRPGLGSTFTMSLPLTLAVLDGMVVSAGSQTLVAPLTAIVETLQPKRSEVHAMGDAGRVMAIRGAYVPVVDVGAALGYRSEPLQPDEGVALLIEGENGRAVLLVDAIQGQRQVVIKSLEANYRRVPGIAAATILGDGRVALILDIDALVAASRVADAPARQRARRGRVKSRARPMTSCSERRERLVEGEFLFTGEDFRRIAAALHAASGIALPDSKATLVYSRLAKRLRALGLENFRDYCALISGAEGLDERQEMVVALTTNVTRFFREPHHFEHLARQVLPSLLAGARRGQPVRIWSAGCSNGQEPYSIALTILSLMPEAADYDIKVLATDIDTQMIAMGRTGLYSAAAVAPIPAEMRTRWFEREGDAWRAAEPLKRLVTFNELNLMGEWPMRKAFDAVWCRNVVIYFEEETQARLFSRFVGVMRPGAHLYIGHSERISGEAAERLETDGVTTYRLKGQG